MPTTSQRIERRFSFTVHSAHVLFDLWASHFAHTLIVDFYVQAEHVLNVFVLVSLYINFDILPNMYVFERYTACVNAWYWLLKKKLKLIPFNSHIHNGHNSVCFQVPKLVDVFEYDLILCRLLLTETKAIDFIDGIPTKHKLLKYIFIYICAIKSINLVVELNKIINDNINWHVCNSENNCQ